MKSPNWFAFRSTQAAVFAIAFAEDDAVIAAANDGKIRRISPDGELEAEFEAVEISDQQAAGSLVFDAKAWNEVATQRLEAAAREAPLSAESPIDQSVERLLVEPTQVELHYTLRVCAADCDRGDEGWVVSRRHTTLRDRNT